MRELGCYGGQAGRGGEKGDFTLVQVLRKIELLFQMIKFQVSTKTTLVLRMIALKNDRFTAIQ